MDMSKMGKGLRSLILCAILNSIWTVEGSSPVVIWTLKRIGEANVQSNLNEFSAEQFADLLAWKTEQGNIPIIAFGLDSLSLEDLTPQGSVGSTEPFRKLRRITDASAETLLYPSVQSAGDAIALLQSKGFQVLQVDAGEPLPKIEVPNTILVISEKASVNMDDEILRVFSKYTLDFPNIMGMLWGKHSTWTEEPDEEVNEIISRKKRQAPAPPAAPKVFPITGENGLFMVFRDVVLKVFHRTDKGNPVTFTSATPKITTNGTHETVVTLQFPNSQVAVKTTRFDLTFKFVRDNLGYWGMKNATVVLEGSDSAQFRFMDIQLSSAVAISVPVGWSFHCSRFGGFRPLQKPEELKQNHTFSIDIRGFQMQVFMPEPSTERFAREYECVGFFTPGIWSGIVVTIMLLSVLTWGLKMIMDVKTMDRFDDPKGKPISFGSGE